MTDPSESLDVADRVLTRVASGVVTFRAMNAAEEPHVLRALAEWKRLGMAAADLAVENARMAEELAEHRKRAAESITI